MKGLFWIIALFGLAVAVALGARVSDGYVLLVVPPWRAEISLNLFVVALIALVVALYVGLRIVALTLGLPQRVREYNPGAPPARARRCGLPGCRALPLRGALREGDPQGRRGL